MRNRWIRFIIWRGIWAVLVLALLAGALFWLSQSSLLAIEEIEVEGNRAISLDEIMEKAGPLLKGESLLKLSFDDVNRILMESSFAESVEMERDFPHTIRIRIREYRPFVNVKGEENRIYIVSAEGRTLTEIAQTTTNFPVLSTKEPCDLEPGSNTDCPDVATGVWFLANIPVNFNQEFAEIIVADGDITAKMKSGVTVHFGSLDDYGLKFEVMRQLLARTAAQGADSSIDVSVPERPVTKDNPAATTPASTSDSEDAATAVTEDPVAPGPQTGEQATEPEAPVEEPQATQPALDLAG